MEAELQKQKAEVKKAQRRQELEMRCLELEQTHQGPVTETPRQEDRAKTLKFPSLLDGKDDLDAYLQQFEQCATTAKWVKNGWATKLSVILSGRAVEVYSRLSDEAAVYCDQMKLALMTV